ncbi:sugar phosphate isomerase/epimerase family protein [Microbacterium sp. YY-01]|uniref:sugar phosphate isomerase/epimerase family protein n=1 Tax=Microbacterium sp. YY-01 TaxID=3421634 RepID=UPI003D173643
MSSPQLSLQLYTVREALENDIDGTLERIASFGIRNVEAFGFVGKATELRKALDAAGLISPSGHANFLSDTLQFGEHTIEVPAYEVILDDAAEMGIEILIDPMVMPHRWANEDEVKRTAERLNNAIDAAAERGMRLGYHNHSHEFHAEFNGVTAYETFAALLDERAVLEVDVFWAAVAKHDPVALLQRLGDRVRLLHAKDGNPGEDPFLTGKIGEPMDQRVVGEGSLDMPAILAAAPSAEYAAIEFDSYDGDLFDAINRSAQALREAGVQ